MTSMQELIDLIENPKPDTKIARGHELAFQCVDCGVMHDPGTIPANCHNCVCPTFVPWVKGKTYSALARNFLKLSAEVTKLDEIEAHGCLTGDCPHQRQSECDADLAQYLREILSYDSAIDPQLEPGSKWSSKNRHYVILSRDGERVKVAWYSGKHALVHRGERETTVTALRSSFKYNGKA